MKALRAARRAPRVSETTRTDTPFASTMADLVWPPEAASSSASHSPTPREGQRRSGFGLDLGPVKLPCFGRTVSPGWTERVTNRNGELEWDVVLASLPSGAGDLELDAQLGPGLARPVRDGATWSWRTPDGHRVRMGERRVKDATGTELYRTPPSATG